MAGNFALGVISPEIHHPHGQTFLELKATPESIEQQLSPVMLRLNLAIEGGRIPLYSVYSLPSAYVPRLVKVVDSETIREHYQDQPLPYDILMPYSSENRYLPDNLISATSRGLLFVRAVYNGNPVNGIKTCRGVEDVQDSAFVSAELLRNMALEVTLSFDTEHANSMQNLLQQIDKMAYDEPGENQEEIFKGIGQLIGQNVIPYIDSTFLPQLTQSCIETLQNFDTYDRIRQLINEGVLVVHEGIIKLARQKVLLNVYFSKDDHGTERVDDLHAAILARLLFPDAEYGDDRGNVVLIR